VLTKGTVIEVNVSELGLVSASGKVAWGRYAQVTNTPENVSFASYSSRRFDHVTDASLGRMLECRAAGIEGRNGWTLWEMAIPKI
jgi:hypothetical protein